MANVDRPNGFRFVKSLSGAPVSSLIRHIGVADGADLFIGDALNLVAGRAARGATSNADILGVAVGFGKVNADGVALGAYNPDNLMVTYYADSANTHTDWVVYYIPAEDAIFEIQTDAADSLVVGETIDFQTTAGDATTGLSDMEINAGVTTHSDLTVVELPYIVGNDRTLAYGRYHVMFTRAEQAFHA